MQRTLVDLFEIIPSSIQARPYRQKSKTHAEPAQRGPYRSKQRTLVDPFELRPSSK
jgi:hypothetical protein